MNKELLNSRNLSCIGVMTAVTCIFAPLSIPIGPVPISLTNLAIYISIYALGSKKANISYIVYLLIGLVGLPVFSGFSSGPAKLLGPTGGYLIGFIPMTIICGIFIDRFIDKWYMCLIGMIVGTIVAYTLGTAWLAYESGMSLTSALGAGVIPFIPGDLAKIVISILIGPKIRKQLINAKIFEQPHC